MKYYKCFNINIPIGVWTTWRPIVPGYCVCKAENLIHFVNAKIFEVETQGVRDFNIKSVAHRVRLIKQLVWTKAQARQYVIDCAEYHGVGAKYIADARIGNYFLANEALDSRSKLWHIIYTLYMHDDYAAAHAMGYYMNPEHKVWMTRRLNENWFNK